MLYSIRKDKLKQAGFFYLFYFLAMILGVLVGLLFDRSGNMFYAPAFTAFFGGVLFIFYTEKIKTFGLISGLGCLLGLFFLLSRHGFGAFLPGLICGILADLIARSGSYQKTVRSLLAFIVFSFSTAGPIFLMWLAPKQYESSLLARGKTQAYIEQVMLKPEPSLVFWFVVSILLGALLGALLGRKILKARHSKSASD